MQAELWAREGDRVFIRYYWAPIRTYVEEPATVIAADGEDVIVQESNGTLWEGMAMDFPWVHVIDQPS
jgi:hypothetical protein